MKNWQFSLKIFLALIARNNVLLMKKFKDTFINSLIWTGCYITVGSYILPYMGLAKDYGSFLLPGTLVTTALFESSGLAREMLADLEGNRSLVFDFTLPLSSRLVFFAKVVSVALQLSVLTLFILPFGKILLWNNFSLAYANFFHFSLIFIVLNLFCAFFAFWMTGMVDELILYRNVWARYCTPMWIFGCFQFSWVVLHKALPIFAYINLCNPLVYFVEGMRSSLLGPVDFLNIWVCLGMGLFFTVVCAWHGFRLLQKKLDFV